MAEHLHTLKNRLLQSCAHGLFPLLLAMEYLGERDLTPGNNFLLVDQPTRDHLTWSNSRPLAKPDEMQSECPRSSLVVWITNGIWSSRPSTVFQDLTSDSRLEINSCFLIEVSKTNIVLSKKAKKKKKALKDSFCLCLSSPCLSLNLSF